MISWFKSLFPTHPTYIHSIIQLFPSYNPNTHDIFIAKGCMDEQNKQNLINGLPFTMKGTISNCIILHKKIQRTQLDTILSQYQAAIEGTLGAIAAHSIVSNKESSKTIRDCSKLIDSMSVELRRSLIEYDKSLVISNDPTN